MSHKSNGHAAEHKKSADAEWTTRRRAAEICDVKVEDIQNWIRRGKLPFRKRGWRTHVRPKDVKEVRDAFAKARLRPPQWITIREATELCGVDETRIRGWIKNGCPVWGGRRPRVDKHKRPWLVHRKDILEIKRALAAARARASWPTEMEVALAAGMDRTSLRAKVLKGDIRGKAAYRDESPRPINSVFPKDATELIDTRIKGFERAPGWIPSRTGPRPFPERFPEITRATLQRCEDSDKLLGHKLHVRDDLPLLVRIKAKKKTGLSVYDMELKEKKHYSEKELQDIVDLHKEIGIIRGPDGTVEYVTRTKAKEMNPNAPIDRWIRDGKLKPQVKRVLTLHGHPRGLSRRELPVVRVKDVDELLVKPKGRSGGPRRPHDPKFEKFIWDKFSEMIVGANPLQVAIDERRESIEFSEISHALAKDDWKKLLVIVNSFGGVADMHGSRRIKSPGSLKARVFQIARRKFHKLRTAGTSAQTIGTEVVTNDTGPHTGLTTPVACWRGGRKFQIDKNKPFFVTPNERAVLEAVITFGGSDPPTGAELEAKSGVSRPDRILRRLTTKKRSKLAPFIDLPGKGAATGYVVRIVDGRVAQTA